MKSKELPKKYKSNEAEMKWGEFWESNMVHKYDPTAPREKTFVVDTPPPTVSGSLHVGHVFSYTQTDVLTRFQRMRGKYFTHGLGRQWTSYGKKSSRSLRGSFNQTFPTTRIRKENIEKKKKEEEKFHGKLFRSLPKTDR